ncbi:MAG: glycosyltransferase [Nitrospinota bacterium]|nr:MAG: glycosyltransferase [Nitrospinota bacterium]
MSRHEVQVHLEHIAVKKKALENYRPVVGEQVLAEIRSVAGELQGLRVLHLNSTSSGGGVAELLDSMVPLLCDVGLQAEWRVLCKDPEFFQVTKQFHNALQGGDLILTEAMKERYLERNRQCSAMLEEAYDVIVVHDPQPAAIRQFHGPARARWIWRCHIDTSEPHPEVWAFLQPFVEEYDVAVFTMAQFVPPHLHRPRIVCIPPAIDPLSSKNRHLPKYLCREVVNEFGVDLTRPLIIQVARFDPWKDPQGVIEAYRLAKRDYPELQLALIGAMAEDDPEGWEVYKRIRTLGEADPDLYLFTNLTGVGSHEVNAFQRVADVVVQKSIREGFGLVVSEALWKETPVVAGKTGGIPLQMTDGEEGYLVTGVEECAARIVELLEHPERAAAMGQRGQERVRRHFLITRLLLDELKLIRSLV